MTQPTAQTGDIKAPIRVFLHPDTGSRITCIGTVHTAQLSYYDVLSGIIGGIQEHGGQIYAEQVTHPTPDQMAATPENVRFGADVVARMLAAMHVHAKDLGLALQKEALPVREQWRVHDLDMLAVARAYGEQELRRIDGELKQAKYMFASFTPDLRRALFFQALATELKVASGEAPADLLFPGIHLEVAARREAVAFAAFDNLLFATPDASAALVWGAGHLPAFTRALTERGYKQDDEQWITAIDAAFTTPPAPIAQDQHASTDGE